MAKAPWEDYQQSSNEEDGPWADFAPTKTKKEAEKADWGTALKTSFANLGNVADKSISTLAGSAAALFGDQKGAVDIEEGMREREAARNRWANPQGQELGFGGKLAGIPAGVLAGGFSPVDTVDRLLQAGETTSDAITGGLIDAGGNAIGLIAPGFVKGGRLLQAGTGAAANAGQDVATKLAIQAVAETEKGKAQFQPTFEDAAVAAVAGGGFAALHPPQTKKPPTANKTVEAIRAAQEAKKPPTAPETEIPLVDTRTGKQLSKEAYEAALRERELQRTSAFNRHEDHPNLVQESPIDRMVRELGGEPLPKEMTGPDTPMTRMAEDLTSEKTPESVWKAQEELDARQRALEEGVVAARKQDEAITDVSHRRMGPEDTTPSTGQFSLENFKKGSIARRQGGYIHPDLLGVGAINKAIDFVRDNFNKDSVRALLAKFDGTYNPKTMLSEIKHVVNNPGSRLVMMSPDTFHELASDRPGEWQKVFKSDSLRKRVTNGVESRFGLDDIPYLTLDANGKVLAHEGRHRMDVFKKKQLDAVPVLLVNESVRLREPIYSGNILTGQGKKTTTGRVELDLINDQNRHEFSDIRPTNERTLSGELTSDVYHKYNQKYGRGDPYNVKTNDQNQPIRKSGLGKKQGGAINLWQTPDPNSPLGRISSKFKEWFGNSKVVDHAGLPLKVYHGSGETINKFWSKIAINNGSPGHWFTDSPESAKFFSRGTDKVQERFLSIQNPFEIHMTAELGARQHPLQVLAERLGLSPDKFQTNMPSGYTIKQKLLSNGFDGVKFTFENSKDTHWIPLKESQIKTTATGFGKSQRGSIDPDLLTFGFSRLFHGGRKFKIWNPNMIKSGEGMLAQGPGLYAGDNSNLAKLYVKFGGENGTLSEMAVDTRKIINPREKLSPEMEQAYETAQKRLDAIGIKATSLGVRSALASAPRHLLQEARQIMIDSGIDGFYTNLGNFGNEYVIFNPDVIAQISPVDAPIEVVPNKKSLAEKFKSQRGSINLWSTPDPDSIVGRIARAFKEEGVDLIDQNLIPPNPELQSVIDTAKAEGPKGDGKFLKNLQSGSTSVAMKTRSPLLLAGSRIGQNALKMTDIHVRNYVMPAENAIRKLSKDDIQTLHEVMLEESRNREMTDRSILAEHLNPDQLIAYDLIRKMQENQLEQVNAARKEKGLEPVDAHEAYLASRWQGDFRRPIYQKVGENGKKLVWYLASNTKMGLARETKNLLKYAEENGIKDLVVDESLDHQVHTSRNRTDLEATYSTMIDLLGRDDPAVKAMAELVEQAKAAEAYNAFGTKKHFENKAGIRGFVGDRPWKNPQKEAIAAFEEQFQQSKNAYSWAFTQKAVDGITKLASDPDLVKMQPKNVAFLRDYAKTLMGMSETKLAKALDDSFRSTGISPKLIQQGVGNLKSYFILTKLGASVGNMVVNTLQTANIPSYLSQMIGAGYRGNPITSIATGMFGGIMMATAHYTPKTSRAMIPDGFLREAVDYAEANGVTARSIVDEAPVGSSKTITGKAVRAVGHTLSGPETLARSVAFMSYAKMLESSGKFTKEQWPQMFQLAEEYTNKSMVDYRQTEHAMIYGKGGTVGKALNVLQTYPMSFWNQYSFMAREAAKGNPWGLLTMLPTHYLLAGVAGIPAVEALDKLYKLVKDNLLSTETWAELNESPFWRDPKAWLIDQMGQGYYGKLSVDTGINWTSRLGAPGPESMVMAPGGAAVELFEQGLAVGKAALDPTNSTKWAQAGMKTVPVALQGLLEQSGAMKDHTYVIKPETGEHVYQKVTDLVKREGQYTRSPKEEKIRNFGLRSQKEVMTRDMMYSIDREVKLGQQKAAELPDRIYDAARRGDQQKANTLAALYMSISKDQNAGTTLEEALKRATIAEYTTTEQKAALGIKESVNKAIAYARARKALESVK